MKQRKNFLGFIFPIVLLVLLSACRTKQTDKPVITVATDADTKPYTYKEENTLKGYDIDLIRAVFKELPEYQLELQVTEFSSITTGLDTGRFQIGANNFGKNKEREKKYYFSTPLSGNANVLASNKKNDFQSLAELAGKTTEAAPGVNYTNVLEQYNKENPDKAVKILYTEADFATRINDLASGKIDFILHDAISTNQTIKDRGFTNLVTQPLPENESKDFGPNYDYLLFSREKDGEKLQKKVDKVLKKLANNGTLKKLSQEYFNADYAPKAEPVKPKIFDVSVVFSSIPKLLAYLPITLEITVVSMIFGLLIGLIFAIIKVKKIPVLHQVLAVFVSFIRGTPIIVQLYLTYNGIPLILRMINESYGTNYNINAIPSLLFVLVTFSINESAYNSETIRAAIQSVDKGQIEAAESLGMTYLQVMRRIILPEASVVAIPPLANALIGLLKSTSLAFVASVVEMTAEGKIISGASYRYFEVYLALAIIYWALTILIEFAIRFLENKMAINDPRNAKKRLFGREIQR